MTEKTKNPGETSGSKSFAAPCYSPTFDLLKKMEEASPVKCICWIEIVDDGLSMRWNGTFKRGKHSKKEEFGMQRSLTRFDEPFIETILEDVSYALRAIFKEAGE